MRSKRRTPDKWHIPSQTSKTKTMENTHTHTQRIPKQSKEKKVQESDLENKGNQKRYKPIKNKTD